MWIDYIRYALLAVLLAGAVYQDLKERKIRNKWNVPFAIAGLLTAFFSPSITFVESVIGMAAAFAVTFVCWRLKVFRAGDAKLFCAMGTYLGWKLFLNCFLEAVLIGGVLGIGFVIYRQWFWKKEEKLTFPFSISIAAACIIAVHFGCIWEIIGWK